MHDKGNNTPYFKIFSACYLNRFVCWIFWIENHASLPHESLAIVLLIVAHALRHVQTAKPERAPAPQPTLQLTPELIQELRALLLPTTVSEEQPETPQL